jgi:hypothetical protein
MHTLRGGLERFELLIVTDVQNAFFRTWKISAVIKVGRVFIVLWQVIANVKPGCPGADKNMLVRMDFGVACHGAEGGLANFAFPGSRHVRAAFAAEKKSAITRCIGRD